MADWEALAERVAAAGVRFGIAPHVRFTNRINYQALWIQRSSDNAPTFKKKLVPWLSVPFEADQ